MHVFDLAENKNEAMCEQKVRLTLTHTPTPTSQPPNPHSNPSPKPYPRPNPNPKPAPKLKPYPNQVVRKAKLTRLAFNPDPENPVRRNAP